MQTRYTRRRRMPPDMDLSAPVKRFDETFSAETVVMDTFFPTAEKPARLAAASTAVLSDV